MKSGHHLADKLHPMLETGRLGELVGRSSISGGVLSKRKHLLCISCKFAGF